MDSLLLVTGVLCLCFKRTRIAGVVLLALLAVWFFLILGIVVGVLYR